MAESFFQRIENKTGVSMEEIFALANAIQHADFKDERQVRKIIRKVSKVANKPVPRELEDRITTSILNSGTSLNIGDIQKMIDNSKK